MTVFNSYILNMIFVCLLFLHPIKQSVLTKNRILIYLKRMCCFYIYHACLVVLTVWVALLYVVENLRKWDWVKCLHEFILYDTYIFASFQVGGQIYCFWFTHLFLEVYLDHISAFQLSSHMYNAQSLHQTAYKICHNTLQNSIDHNKPLHCMSACKTLYTF